MNLLVFSCLSFKRVRWMDFSVWAEMRCRTWTLHFSSSLQTHEGAIFKTTKLLLTLKDLPGRGVGCWQP